MKRLCFLFSCLYLLVGGATEVLAQTEGCGTEISPEIIEHFLKTHRPQGKLLKSVAIQDTIKIPIKAHIVRKSDSTGGLAVSDLRNELAIVNERYKAKKMKFFIFGNINYVNDDTYYDFDTSEEAALCNPRDLGTAINIYFCKGFLLFLLF